MWYLVAAEEKDLNAPIAKRFGHASYHLLVHQATGDIRICPGAHDDPVTHEPGARHGHGFDRFIGESIHGIISSNMGPHAFQQASKLGWKVYIVRSKTVSEALQEVEAGRVDAAQEATLRQSVHDGQHKGNSPHGEPHPRHGGGHGKGGCCGH